MGAKKDLRTLFFRFFFVVAYCLAGAGIFYAIEHNDSYEEEINRKQQLYNKTKRDIMKRFGINITEFKALETKLLDARSETPPEWTFSRGLDLCWQTLTTVGYGNKTPTTLGGQLFLIPFAVFGIPLTLFMLNTVGENICHFAGFIFVTIEKRLLKREEITNCKVKLLCSVSFLTVLLLVFMAAVSVNVEGWSFGLALYVWFVTFTTVGFGDYIPGNGSSKADSPQAIIYRLILVVIGLSLISTIFNAMTDCIKEKREKAESKSWLRFVISAFTCGRQTENKDKNVTEMTARHPTT